MSMTFPRMLSRSFSFGLSFASLAAALLLAAPQGARAEGPTHEIRKTEPKVVAGAKASASLTIAARNGWHVNEEAPITLSLATSDATVTVAKSKLGRADLAESTKETARFDIPFSVTDPGTKTINAEAKFVMCQQTACKPVKETLAFNIEVSAPPTASATPAKAKGKKKP
jgi:DsbC/DsbD-like thiol-disulfide interchange protein